ncbi:hypothetical protein [Stieleria mannarensis]|uniref:hypothetical protein n=1 Tax=Stieleria mannarensis TaxID=2755585 RepID=UPI00160349FB|nr:hypothetical protein [Rhodopirellula sp. JC639]
MTLTTLNAARFRILVGVLAISSALIVPSARSSTASAQDERGENTTAAQTEKPSGIAVTVTPAGVQRFASGGWASLAVVGVNYTDQDAEEVVSVFVGDDPNLQFSTRVWIPAHSKRQSWLPIAIPPKEQITGNRVDLSMIRVTQSGGGESFGENINQMPVSQRSLMLVDDEINTGFFADPPGLVDTTDGDTRRRRLNRVLNAGRDSVTTDPRELPIVSFLSNFLPPTHGALAELDQVVIAGDQLQSDSEGIRAVRHWIRRGGRAWIMLDLTSRSLVDDLLGDDSDHSVIDRVELNDFDLNTRDPIGGSAGSTEAWTSESPVEMLRVLTPSDEVVCRIDGWPVAFWKQIGDGEVLFTTLGGAGWVHADQRATFALTQLSRRFFEPKNPRREFVRAMQPIVDNQIGYRIPSRTLAAVILGLNALVILVGGIWWTRQRRLERMAFLVPVSATVTTVIMLVIGSSHTAAIPSTVATGQVVQVRTETDEADVSTVRAVYTQQSSDLGLVSRDQVMTMPLEDTATSETRRLSLENDGTSRWIGPPQPTGVVRHLVSDSTLSLGQPIQVRGTFDADGFRGTLHGIDPATCGDALVVASPAPMTSVEIESASTPGIVTAKSSDLLSPGQFIPGSLLTDRQRTRQAFLRDLFASVQGDAPRHSLGDGPSLLLWTDPIDVGVQFAPDFEQRGAALVSVPIQIDRPEPGTEFRIPSTFVRTDTYDGAQGRTTLFNPRTGKWLPEMTKAAEAQLMFRFPEAVAAMSLDRVHVTMKVNAPSRTLFAKALVDGQPANVFSRDNATGVIEFTIDRRDALRLQDDGGLWLAVGVTESTEAKQQQTARSPTAPSQSDPSQSDQLRPDDPGERFVDNTTWQIDYVHLDAVATIRPGDLPSLVEASETGSQ